MSEYRFSLLHILLTIGMNLLVLASVFVGMYRASQVPDDFVFTFFKTILFLIPLSLAFGLGGRRILKRFHPSAQQVSPPPWTPSATQRRSRSNEERSTPACSMATISTTD